MNWIKAFFKALFGIFCRNVKENKKAIATQVAKDVREAVSEIRK